MPRLIYLLIPLAYLLGSIPFGLLVGRSQGIDPRTAGSGNIGATNVGRLLGGKFFALVFVLDLLKGLAPMLAAWVLLRHEAPTRQTFGLWLLVGFAAIAGHMFSVFLGFKGGKGVATSTGVILGLFPYYTIPGILAAIAWFIAFKLSHYIGLASVIGALCFPLAYVAVGLWCRWPITREQSPLLIFAVVVALMIVIKHRGNLARVFAGTEHRFTETHEKPPTA